jgi:uncharacterized protein
MTDMTLICPKCHDTMKSYERNGVTLEQCNECRGIFLDRGELEHLVAAEARYNAAVTGAPAPVAAPPPPAYSEPRYDPRPDPYYDPRHDPRHDPRYDKRYSGDRRDEYYKKKRKRSFLDDLFDD